MMDLKEFCLNTFYWAFGVEYMLIECEFKMKYFQSYLVLDALIGEIDEAYLKGIERYAFE